MLKSSFSGGGRKSQQKKERKLSTIKRKVCIGITKMVYETVTAAGGLIKWFLLDSEDLSLSVSASQRHISKSASLKNISTTENKCSYFFLVIQYTRAHQKKKKRREKYAGETALYFSLPLADHIPYSRNLFVSSLPS